jgi:nucleotide-binding universal stress UspA family protein
MDERTFHNILLVVEGADGDRNAALAAIDLAVLHKAKLVVLNVVDVALINRMKVLTAQSASEIEIEMEEKGWRALYYAEETSKGRGVPTTILQKSGMPAHEILNEAGRLGIDLIVMGYPRRVAGQARRLAHGHIERVVEESACAVLVAK